MDFEHWLNQIEYQILVVLRSQKSKKGVSTTKATDYSVDWNGLRVTKTVKRSTFTRLHEPCGSWPWKGLDKN